MRPRRSWLPYLALLPVLVVALVVGAGRGDGRVTAEERVERISKEVRCPTCESQSVADSRAPASEAIRQEVRRRVDAGESDAAIRSFLVSRYGKDVLLEPETKGVSALVWALPVLAVAMALAGLAVAFRRWGSRPRSEASAEDRALVEQARAQ